MQGKAIDESSGRSNDIYSLMLQTHKTHKTFVHKMHLIKDLNLNYFNNKNSLNLRNFSRTVLHTTL